jgi:hypothetical protein
MGRSLIVKVYAPAIVNYNLEEISGNNDLWLLVCYARTVFLNNCHSDPTFSIRMRPIGKQDAQNEYEMK